MKIQHWLSGLAAVGLLVACGSDKDPQDASSSPISSVESSSSSSITQASNILINEVVAKSVDANFLAGNDWIELYNADSVPVDLAQYGLADSGSEVITLPSLTLNPGEYIVIAAVDADDSAPPIPNVPFKLGSEDSVSLYFGSQLVDQLEWLEDAIPSGASFGNLNGGVAQVLNPTPAAQNLEYSAVEDVVRGNPIAGDPLQISEVTPQSDRPSFYDGEDWVELRNTGASAVNLADYALTDSESPLQTLPDILLPPGERIVVVAGGTAPTDGTPFVTFKLGREDSLSVFNGQQEVDFIAWSDEQSKNGRSFGRLAGEEQILYPTPGYDNVEYILFTRDEVFTVKVDVDPQDWNAILANPQAEEYYPANFELNGAKISNVGFRVKGQGSLNFIQNSIRYGFKVDMNEYEDQKFMGMKKLVFNQSFSDPSFMRDTLSYDLMRQAGVPSPEVSYVDLWVAGEHLGLYQMVEMIDTEFLEKHFTEDEDDLGDLYKGELGQRLLWVDDNIASYTGLRLKTNESTVGAEEEGLALLEFLDGINNGASADQYVDLDLTIRYLAASVLIGNMDNPIGATANNFYLYEQRSAGTFTLIPWDYNLAMGMWGNGPAITIGGDFGFGGGFGGGFDFGDFDFGDFDFGDFGGALDPLPVEPEPVEPEIEECRIVNHVIDNPIHDTNSARPMFDLILQNDVYRQRYRQEIQNLLDTVFNEQNIRAEVNRIAQLIDPYVQADPTKFFTYEEWQLSLEQGLPSDSDITAGRGAGVYGPAPGIIEFVRERATNVQMQLNGELPSSNNGGTACPL